MTESKEQIVDKVVHLFDQGYACSQSLVLGFADNFNLDQKTAKLISSTFGGGMGRLRLTCGAVTGAFMVLGLKFGNEDPKDMDTKLNAYKKVQELAKRFELINQTSNCKEILKQYATAQQVAERKHHKIICRKVVGDAAAILYDIVTESE